jgi:TatD DNase family protein
MISYYDAHNHLHDERLAGIEPNVKACVVNGTRESDWPAVEALAQKHSWIIPAFGLHPWYASERSANWFDTLRYFLDRNSNATIGEIGLDRWMENHDIADQEKVFIAQLDLAAERNVAASIHCLKAWGHLESALQTANRPSRGFLLHSYGGPAEMIPSFTKLGAYFSISGYFAREGKEKKRDTFKSVPIDRILVETDAPDMLPPERYNAYPNGNINDPRNIERAYSFAATVFDLPDDRFAAQIEQNFLKLFSLPTSR